MTDRPHLTPAEELLIELLVARHRPTIRRLEAKGLVHTEAAVTPHIEGSLTDLGRELFMSFPYNPPAGDVEWGVLTGDDTRPVHYVMRSSRGAPEDSEDWHRKYAARNGGLLFRRVVPPVGEWQQVPLEVTR